MDTGRNESGETCEGKVRRFYPDPQIGLTKDQVVEHVRAHAVNKKVDSSTSTVKEIIRSNVCTYFNLIFLVLGILLIAAGSFRDLTFLPVIIANTCIGIAQEIQAKKVLDDLNILNAPSCTVIRDGEEKTIKAEHLVLDDIAVFSAGNQIPADAVILSGEVAVNEAMITGESDEVQKKVRDRLLSGSFVVSGNCRAQLEKVGEDSYISRLTLQATKTKNGEQSEMIRSLNRLVMAAGILIIPIGLTLFIQQFVLAEADFGTSVSSMVAAVIGMIPEGLYLLASVALAVSAMRLAKQKVLLHDMKCIETLARVDVLCVDKTGTITVPEMEVSGFVPVRDGEQFVNDKICDFVTNMTVDNATMEALGRYFTNDTGRKAKKVISFSSAYKYSAVEFADEKLVLGAPEFVLGNFVSLYSNIIEQYTKNGYRVLVFGRYKGTLDGGAINERVEPIAFIYLSNAIRKGAVETFSYFAENGVDIKVISGDNPGTVSEIAKKAGINNAEKYIDASTLEGQADINSAVKEYTVFGRVTPVQKRMFVKALKEAGRTVAMTGDGVNDVLALKDADCSIAMASGSEAACQVAQLVLLDSDFSRMPSVVAEGRRVVNNIQRSATLYLVKNIFSMLLAIFSMILMLNYPLEPSQVSLISMFTIGIPSFVLALEPNKEKIKGHFMHNVLIKALPAGLTDFLVVSGLVVFCREFNVDAECVSTSCTILVAIVGFMILYEIAKPMIRMHIILLVGVILGWLFCMLFISPLFAITSISKQCAMLMVVFALITEPALRYLTKLSEWLKQRLNL
ncbi:MAG: HAD-IC family P-type ATPase [Lachnospiraceae bacterium]|nr:HAD-IC family P-type ATPase [Lachnospiraceae bacterium]